MQNITAYGLDISEVEALREIFMRHEPLEKAVIFGSRAKGNHREGSDVDIALTGPTMQFSDIVTLSLAIDELYLPFRVDLVLFNRIKEKALVSHIERVGKVIFEKEE